MVLEPAAHIHQQREAGGVALGKAVFAEALDLLEDALREFLGVAVGHHAADMRSWNLCTPPLRFQAAIERRRLSDSPALKPGGQHRDLHHLLLEDRHAQRAAQRLAQALAGIVDRLQALAALQVGVHHAALDRPGRTMATSITRS
jgi:hypothetical protein